MQVDGQQRRLRLDGAIREPVLCTRRTAINREADQSRANSKGYRQAPVTSTEKVLWLESDRGRIDGSDFNLAIHRQQRSGQGSDRAPGQLSLGMYGHCRLLAVYFATSIRQEGNTATGAKQRPS
jgi:hypothetical protein